MLCNRPGCRSYRTTGPSWFGIFLLLNLFFSAACAHEMDASAPDGESALNEALFNFFHELGNTMGYMNPDINPTLRALHLFRDKTLPRRAAWPPAEPADRTNASVGQNRRSSNVVPSTPSERLTANIVSNKQTTAPATQHLPAWTRMSVPEKETQSPGYSVSRNHNGNYFVPADHDRHHFEQPIKEYDYHPISDDHVNYHPNYKKPDDDHFYMKPTHHGSSKENQDASNYHHMGQQYHYFNDKHHDYDEEYYQHIKPPPKGHQDQPKHHQSGQHSQYQYHFSDKHHDHDYDEYYEIKPPKRVPKGHHDQPDYQKTGQHDHGHHIPNGDDGAGSHPGVEGEWGGQVLDVVNRLLEQAGLPHLDGIDHLDIPKLIESITHPSCLHSEWKTAPSWMPSSADPLPSIFPGIRCAGPTFLIEMDAGQTVFPMASTAVEHFPPVVKLVRIPARCELVFKGPNIVVDSTCILGLNKKKNWELKFGGKRIFGKKAAPTKRTREDGRRDRK